VLGASLEGTTFCELLAWVVVVICSSDLDSAGAAEAGDDVSTGALVVDESGLGDVDVTSGLVDVASGLGDVSTGGEFELSLGAALVLASLTIGA